jgi:Protein of unknown function (DUF3710)
MFRRRKQADPSTDLGASGDEAVSAEAAAPSAAGGPFDAADVEVGDDPLRVDLGSLVVKGGPGLELQLQVDEASQVVTAVMLVSETGAVELRPFAAPRNEGVWDDVRRELAAEATRRGGTASEIPGEYGKELHVVAPVTGPRGEQRRQPSRVIGIDGPRWMLRATFFGSAATDPDPGGVLEQALRDVVVVRGSAPIPPRAPLPLRMPGNVQPMDLS